MEAQSPSTGYQRGGGGGVIYAAARNAWPIWLGTTNESKCELTEL